MRAKLCMRSNRCMRAGITRLLMQLLRTGRLRPLPTSKLLKVRISARMDMKKCSLGFGQAHLSCATESQTPKSFLISTFISTGAPMMKRAKVGATITRRMRSWWISTAILSFVANAVGFNTKILFARKVVKWLQLIMNALTTTKNAPTSQASQIQCVMIRQTLKPNQSARSLTSKLSRISLFNNAVFLTFIFIMSRSLVPITPYLSLQSMVTTVQSWPPVCGIKLIIMAIFFQVSTKRALSTRQSWLSLVNLTEIMKQMIDSNGLASRLIFSKCTRIMECQTPPKNYLSIMSTWAKTSLNQAIYMASSAL